MGSAARSIPYVSGPWPSRIVGGSLPSCALVGLVFVALAVVGEAAAGVASFSTRSGTFTPQAWSAVTGWDRDDHSEALAVFRRTCASLQKRPTWRAACAAAQTARNEPAAARAFFEREFVPYLVTATDRGKDGLLTGYFEPVLQGSPVSRGAYTVPVYGAPADLLYLDVRRWQGIDLRRGPHRARLDGNQVVPVGASAGDTSSSPASYQVEPLCSTASRSIVGIGCGVRVTASCRTGHGRRSKPARQPDCGRSPGSTMRRRCT